MFPSYGIMSFSNNPAPILLTGAAQADGLIGYLALSLHELFDSPPTELPSLKRDELLGLSINAGIIVDCLGKG